MADEDRDKKAGDVLVQRIMMRVAWNVEHTGHPFHHQTACGRIVDADPTLEEMMRGIPPEMRLPIPAPLSDVPRAFPIDRKLIAIGTSQRRGRSGSKSG